MSPTQYVHETHIMPDALLPFIFHTDRTKDARMASNWHENIEILYFKSGSATAMYPHKIFEIGKVAYLDETENTGTTTKTHLGFLTAASNANFNEAASEVSSLLYFLDHNYEVKESNDSRFIPGRQAAILVKGKEVGVFGELHPQILENWNISTPCVAGEIDLEELM